MWVTDQRALTAAMTTTPAYLSGSTAIHPAAVDLRDRQIPLGHRSRARHRVSNDGFGSVPAALRMSDVVERPVTYGTVTT